MGGPQGRSGRGGKVLLSQGFEPWTVQSVASRYTDYAIQAAVSDLAYNNNNNNSVNKFIINVLTKCHDSKYETTQERYQSTSGNNPQTKTHKK